jgi:hypothetical protein
MIEDVEMMDLIGDIDLEEIMNNHSSQNEIDTNDKIYKLVDLIRLMRENKLLTKRVKFLETLAKNRNKSNLTIDNYIQTINQKKGLLESMGVIFETKNVTIYNIDNNRKKDKKKNKRKINLN